VRNDRQYSSGTGKFERTRLASEFSKKLCEIYIDEYQDVNPIQDMIFRAICLENEDGFEKNRFMVGDIKQSIYRFRGARPELFDSYRNEFEDIESEGPRSKIFLSLCSINGWCMF
jgi:ATP-dependent helicase/nuclease subunit A